MSTLNCGDTQNRVTIEVNSAKASREGSYRLFVDGKDSPTAKTWVNDAVVIVQMDANLNGVPEAIEDTPGARIKQGQEITLDLARTNYVGPTNAPDYMPGTVTLSAESGKDHIEVWDGQEKIIHAGQDKVIWDNGTTFTQKTLKVKGVSASPTQGVKLKFAFSGTAGKQAAGVTCSDTVTLTVAGDSAVTVKEVAFTNDCAVKGIAGGAVVEYPDAFYLDADSDGNPERNGPVCFVMGTSPVAKVTFHVGQPFIEPTTVWVKGRGLGNNVDLGPFKIENCTGEEFSAEIPAAPGRAVIPEVQRDCAAIAWSYCVKRTLPADSEYLHAGCSSLGAKLYVILGTPQAPMAKPWIEVLDRACSWAATARNETAALPKLTQLAFFSLGNEKFTYDGTQTHAGTSSFKLKDFLTQTGNEKSADCQDMSAFVYVAAKALGCANVRTQLIAPRTGGPGTYVFAFKARLDLVGTPKWALRENNVHSNEWRPFPYGYGELTHDPTTTAYGLNCKFAVHQLVELGGKVYDPTLQVEGEYSCPAGLTQAAYRAKVMTDDTNSDWQPAEDRYTDCQ